MEPIAVIGMSCRFPGEASDIEGFWNLLNRGHDAWSKFPHDRLNQEAFRSLQGHRNGMFNPGGGHFLRDDVSQFDAPFFQITPDEAKSMDPQLRLLLEVAYESVENAGWTLNNLKGSRTSVYTALYTHDYSNIVLRDPEYLPPYTITGNGEAMFSNRLSYFFDLAGPSLSLDTGCSGSLVAVHAACQSILSGECQQSILGSTNLILDPASMLLPGSLPFYSDDGRSYAFDHRASGYGRGEGVACMVLKSLSQARKDGDPIRAVIRASALNQDGRTSGITAPNPRAQETLIRETYAKGGIDPSKTVYVEAHGSGTALGDDIETTALFSAFAPHRKDNGSPLLVGSVKTNIGHLESVSGLASLIKAVLIVEKGVIPPSLHVQKRIKRLDGSMMDVATGHHQLADLGSSQISINSFGYGGTNGHVVIDAGHDQSAVTAEQAQKRPLLFVLSAASQQSTKLMAARLSSYLNSGAQNRQSFTFLERIAYTLCQRRSLFPWRATILADSVSSIQNKLAEPGPVFAQAPKTKPKILFVFTGQGAQWYAMGRELMRTSPVFRRSIEKAEDCLRDLGAEWSLQAELSRDQKTCRLHEALFGQPATVAIQLGLVDLLSSWNVSPNAVIGHSGGETAAAYGCGAMSFHGAMLTAYTRGYVSKKLEDNNRLHGKMLAVGLSEADVNRYLSRLNDSKDTQDTAIIACINSPKSVTVSGDSSMIERLQNALTDDQVMNRALPVNVAYHSRDTISVAEDYLQLLSDLSPPASSSIPYYSSVYGKKIDNAELGAKYWVENFTRPVRFTDALQGALQDLAEDRTAPRGETERTIICEIGPHSTLKGPIKQTLGELGITGCEFQYVSMLNRQASADQSTLEVAEFMLQNGIDVSLQGVNFGDIKQLPSCLTDLPPYSWNHSTSYWHESRLSRRYRQRQDPPHPLLGVLTPDSCTMDLRWRKYISSSDPHMNWLSGHAINGRIIFPAGGYICMAYEAAMQYGMQENPRSQLGGVVLSNVSFSQSLIIPSGDTVEVMFWLRPSTELKGRDLSLRHEFVIVSFSNGDSAVEHCRGFIGFTPDGSESPKAFSPLVSGERHTVDPNVMYERLWEIGNQYTGPFRSIKEVSAANANAYARVSASSDPRGLTNPATMDCCLQSLFPAIISCEGLTNAIMPTWVGEIVVWNHDYDEQYPKPTDFDVFCQVEKSGKRNYSASIDVADGRGSLLSLTSLEATLTEGHAQTHGKYHGQHVQNLILTPDPVFLKGEQIRNIGYSVLAKHPPTPQHGDLLAQVCRHYAKVALSQISRDNKSKIKGHLRCYLNWLEKLVAQSAPAENGCVDAESLIKRALRDAGSDGQVVCRIGKNLSQILEGKVESLALLRENDLLSQVYENDEPVWRCTLQAAEMIRLHGMKNPNQSILEIGAGTGSATLPILQALDGPTVPLFGQYVFTDISAGFWVTKPFPKWNKRMQFRTLDISESPEQQGFNHEVGSYDLIVASNVLHATPNIRQTLSNVCKLLKPGGQLYLIELTKLRIHTSFSFGSLAGWWYGANGRDSPLLPVSEWNEALKDSGFSGVDTRLYPYEPPKNQPEALIIATKIDGMASSSHENEISIALSQQQLRGPPSGLGNRLGKVLSQSALFQRQKLSSLGDSRILGNTCLCLAGLDGGYWETLRKADFAALKEMINSPKGVIWVTHGATGDCPNPLAALAHGFARVVQREYPESRIIMVDLDPSVQSADELASSLLQITEYISRTHLQTHEDGVDVEYVNRDGRWLVPRLVQDRRATQVVQPLSTTFSQMEPISSDSTFRLALDNTKTIDDVHFRVETVQQPLGPEEVEIEVKATGLNFRDTLILLGALDSEAVGEYSGVVTRVGSSLQRQFSLGDRVYTWGTPAHCNRFRAQGSVTKHIPSWLSFEEAASLPVVCNTAYYCLLSVARLKRGEKILIHSGAGGVGQAAIGLALHLGAVVFTTVGSEEKKKLLVERFGLSPSNIFSTRTGDFRDGIKKITRGAGVDVVVNSLAGSFLQDSINVLAAFGRFIEIGKRDLQDAARMELSGLEKNISMTFVDMHQLLRHRLETAAELASDVDVMVRDGDLQPPSPIKSFPVSQVEDAFRHFQGAPPGKTVLTFGPDDHVKVVSPPPQPVKLDSSGTYLVAGGQGGIGREVCSWMAKSGAKNIVILSPSGASKPSIKDLMIELASMGTRLIALACDIGDIEQLTSALAECQQTMPPIRGVIHSALVLRDSPFENTTHEDFVDVLNPKVIGSFNLHQALSDQELDFFVILSSYIGLTGNPGQTNYAAASTFQDAFARWRTAQGCPTKSLDLGSIKGAGCVYENPERVSKLAAEGLNPVTLEDFLDLLNYAISQPINTTSDTQLAIGFEVAHDGSSKQAQNPLFSHITQGATLLGHGSEDEEVDPAKPEDVLRTALSTDVPAHQKPAMIQKALCGYVSGMTGTAVDDIDISRSLIAHGGDSLVAIEFRNWLAKALGPDFGGGKKVAQLPINDISLLIVETVGAVPN